MSWSVPTFYYKYPLTGLIASSQVTGFEASRLLDRLMSTWWSSNTTAVPILITFDAGGGNSETADYLYVSGHNLGTIGATITLQSSTNGFDSTGSDLVTNGAFTSDTTGWTAASATLASVASGESGNCLEVTNSGAAAGSAYQDVTGLTVGNYYKVTAYFKKGTGVSGAIKIGTTSDDDAYQAWTALTDVDWTAYTVSFKATETTARITLANESATATETALFDTVSTYLVDSTNVVSHTPTDNLTFAKEFTQIDVRATRLEITGTLSAEPYISMAYWGDKVETTHFTRSLEPDGWKEMSNINKSQTGEILGVHNNYDERTGMNVTFSNVENEGTIHLNFKDWRETVRLLNFGVAWEKTEHTADVWTMSMKPGTFKAPLIDGGLYRNISFGLTGVKE